MTQLSLSFALTATAPIRRLRGGSQALLMSASDGNSYVTKFRNNPQHIRVLANELLACRLGKWLGLSVPRVEIIDVPQELIERYPDTMRIESAGHTMPYESGLQLGSCYVAKDEPVLEYLPESMLDRVDNIREFAQMLVLDKWTGNADGRQVVFTRALMNRRRYTATFIDQGYCFNAGEWSFPDLALHGIYYHKEVYAHVTGWDAFEPVLTRTEEMDLAALWNMAKDIPESWYQEDAAGLCRLIESLYQRRTILRDLITKFRLTARNPFPHWQQN